MFHAMILVINQHVQLVEGLLWQDSSHLIKTSKQRTIFIKSHTPKPLSHIEIIRHIYTRF